MKRIFYLCVILLCSANFVFAQGKSRRTNTKKPVAQKKTSSAFAEAEKAWTPFWQNFKNAIKSRNKNALFEMMSKEYDTSGLYDNWNCGDLSDKREAFFCIVEKREIDVWEYFDWIFAKKTRVEKINKTNLDGKISRTVSNTNPDGGTLYAIFVYGNNGKWYLYSRTQGGFV